MYHGLLLFFQAKQRASIKWLLSKAYNHKTPPELVEPFYKDHDVSTPGVMCTFGFMSDFFF